MANRTRHHGLALMLVIAVIAMASLIGYAMLSNAALQAQAAGNHERAAVADYLAESAVQTAGYYLQRDLVGMPSSWETEPGYTVHAQNVTVSGVDGSFDIAVTPTTMTDVYQVVATGRSGGSTPLTRTVTSNIKVIRATPTYSVGFGGNATILPQNFFTGAPVTSGGVLGGTGLVAAVLGGTRSLEVEDFVVPSVGAGQINYYGADIAGGTYTTPAGLVGTPQTLSSGTIANPGSLTALPTNPGKVFYFPGAVTITGGGTYTGTLISRNKIEIKTPIGQTIQWKREAGFPAMMSDGSIYINSRNLTMTVNGVVFAGAGTGFAPLTAVSGTHFRVNGALLAPPGVTLGAGGMGSMTVTFTPANNNVQNMTTTPQKALALKYLSWDQ